MADNSHPDNEPAVNAPSAMPEHERAIAETQSAQPASGSAAVVEDAGATGEPSARSRPEVPDETSVPGFEFPGDRAQAQSSGKGAGRRGGLLRSLQWLSLAVTLPFLALNGLAAWQARALMNYSQTASADSPPLFAQPPLKRLGAFASGVKIPRPQNNYSPTDIGLAFESHRIDLGNGEFLDGWYIPAAKVEPPTPADSADETAQPTDPEPAAQADAAEADSVSDSVTESASALAPDRVPDAAPDPTPAPPPAAEKRGTVLLFPAYAASKQTLLQEVRLLHRSGYASFAVDLRGVGDSSGSDTTLGRREAADVAATVNYVAETFDNPPIALYGRLLGAGYIMRAIAEFDLQPQALILEDPPAQLFSLTQAAVESVGLPRSPTTQMLTFWGRLFQADEPSAYDPINYAAQITTPTLVLYGSEDSWVSLDEVVGVHGQLQGQKEILGLPSARLTPVSATASGPWSERVGAFLEGSLGESQ